MAIDDNESYELTGYQVKDLASKVRAKADSAALASVATSGLYSDLTGKPTIPTVNNATLTITQNGVAAGTFSANASADTTIGLTDTTYSDMVGASAGAAGTHGLVPAPAAGDENKVLQGDGTWVTPTGTTYTAGANVQISAQNVISATDTTYSDMVGADSSTAGAAGLVPAPAAGDEAKVLSGAGTWINQPTVNNATLTIQRNGTNVDTFTANASTDKTIDIDVHNGVLTSWNLVPTADTTAGWRALFPTNGVYVTFYDGNGSFTNKPAGWGVLTTKISYHDGSTTNFEIYQEFMASGSSSSYFRKGNTNGWYGNASDSGSFTMVYDQLSSPVWRTAWVASQAQAKRTIYLTSRNTCDITPDGQGGVIVDNLPYGYKMVRFTQTQKASFSGKKIGIRGLKASTSAFNRFSGISAGTTKNWSQYSMPSVGSNNATDAFSDSLNSTQLTLEYTCIRCGSGNEWTVAGTLSDYGANTHYQFSILCEAKDDTTVPNIFFRGTSSSDFSIFYSSIEILQ